MQQAEKIMAIIFSFICLQKSLMNIYPISLMIIAKGPYPIPFRTRKLSPSAPMVLYLNFHD